VVPARTALSQNHVRRNFPIPVNRPGAERRLSRSAPFATQLSCCGASTSQEMSEEEHYAHDEDDVNETSGNVKREKPK
jgi:hypothetical protein